MVVVTLALTDAPSSFCEMRQAVSPAPASCETPGVHTTSAPLTRASNRIGAASIGASWLLICDTNEVAPNSYVRPQGETVHPCAVFADRNAVNGGMT